MEQLERKKELQQLHEQEMDSIKGAKSQAAKVTRAQIIENQERLAAAAEGTSKRIDLSCFKSRIQCTKFINLVTNFCKS